MKSFLNREKPTLVSMVQAKEPERLKYLMDKSRETGAEGFGIQLEQLLPEHKTEAVIRDIFAYAGDLPVYFTNYRHLVNAEKSDETITEELLKAAEWGGTLADVMGDTFCRTEGELTVDSEAVEKQIKLIDRLHKAGAEVLMSSHVVKFISAERALEIALEHKRRGADISKIVVSADSMEQQIENMRIINLLKEKLGIPFLFLSGGECRILRRLGGALGNCMSLCVYEYDDIATPFQPLLSDMKSIRDLI